MMTSQHSMSAETLLGHTFTPEEHLALSRGWVSASATTSDLKTSQFLQAIHNRYQIHSEEYHQASVVSAGIEAEDHQKGDPDVPLHLQAVWCMTSVRLNGRNTLEHIMCLQSST